MIEKDKRINSFENLPSWVKWMAQDADGAWWGFEVEPLKHHQGWYENEVGGSVYKVEAR